MFKCFTDAFTNEFTIVFTGALFMHASMFIDAFTPLHSGAWYGEWHVSRDAGKVPWLICRQNCFCACCCCCLFQYHQARQACQGSRHPGCEDARFRGGLAAQLQQQQEPPAAPRIPSATMAGRDLGVMWSQVDDPQGGSSQRMRRALEELRQHQLPHRWQGQQ